MVESTHQSDIGRLRWLMRPKDVHAFKKAKMLRSFLQGLQPAMDPEHASPAQQSSSVHTAPSHSVELARAFVSSGHELVVPSAATCEAQVSVSGSTWASSGERSSESGIRHHRTSATAMPRAGHICARQHANQRPIRLSSMPQPWIVCFRDSLVLVRSRHTFSQRVV